MKSKNFKKIIFWSLFLFLLFTPLFLAASPIPEEPGRIVETIRQVVNRIYGLLLIILGVIAVGALIYAGVRFIFSAGDPEAIKEAKKQVLSVFLGLLIVLFSVGLLSLLRLAPKPEIVEKVVIEPIEIPLITITDGIALIVEIENLQGKIVRYPVAKQFHRGDFKIENLDRITHIDQIFRINIREIIFRNPEKYERYGVIVFDEPNLEGKSKVITEDTKISGQDAKRIGSIVSFVMPEHPHQGNYNLVFYQHTKTKRTETLIRDKFDKRDLEQAIEGIISKGRPTKQIVATKPITSNQKNILAKTENPVGFSNSIKKNRKNLEKFNKGVAWASEINPEIVMERVNKIIERTVFEEITKQILEETKIIVTADDIRRKIRNMISGDMVINHISEEIEGIIPEIKTREIIRAIEEILPGKKIEEIIMGEMMIPIEDKLGEITEKIEIEIPDIGAEIDAMIGGIEGISDQVVGGITKEMKGVIEDIEKKVMVIEDIQTKLDKIPGIPLTGFLGIIEMITGIIETIEKVIEVIELADNFIEKINELMPIEEIRNIAEKIGGVIPDIEKIIGNIMPTAKIENIVEGAVGIDAKIMAIIDKIMPEGEITEILTRGIQRKIFDRVEEMVEIPEIEDIIRPSIERSINKENTDELIQTTKTAIFTRTIRDIEEIVEGNRKDIKNRIKEATLDKKNQIVGEIDMAMTDDEIKENYIIKSIIGGMIIGSRAILNIEEQDIINKTKTMIGGEAMAKAIAGRIKNIMPLGEIRRTINLEIMPSEADIKEIIQDKIKEIIEGIIKGIWEEILKLDEPKRIAQSGERIPKTDPKTNRIIVPPVGAYREFPEKLQETKTDTFEINLQDEDGKQVEPLSMQVIPDPRGKFLIILRNEFDHSHIVQGNISDFRDIQWGKVEKNNQSPPGGGLKLNLDLLHLLDLDDFWDGCEPEWGRRLRRAVVDGDEEQKKPGLIIKGQTPVCVQVISIIPTY